jgi:hypothetical protein
MLKSIFEKNKGRQLEKTLHLIAKKLLDEGKTEEAWKVLLAITYPGRD